MSIGFTAGCSAAGMATVSVTTTVIANGDSEGVDMGDLVYAVFELSAAFHKYGDAPRRRGARIARREEGEYREYLTDEQRSEAGCIGVRMPPYL